MCVRIYAYQYKSSCCVCGVRVCVRRRERLNLTAVLTHSPTHSLTHRRERLNLTAVLTHSLTYPPTHSLTHRRERLNLTAVLLPRDSG